MTTRAQRPAEQSCESPPSLDPVRHDFLLEHASSAGIAFSKRIRESLRSEGRATCGGFPGTLREVRAHVANLVGDALLAKGQVALEKEERDWTTRVAYASARRDWLAHSVREADDSV